MLVLAWAKRDRTDLSHLQSHFLKVPSLPFYSLISMLSKFPADADSSLFWSGVSRDLMFGKINGFRLGMSSRDANNDIA